VQAEPAYIAEADFVALAPDLCGGRTAATIPEARSTWP
jgi:hypothetical protein